MDPEVPLLDGRFDVEQRLLGSHGGGEDAGEAVVVFGRNGVKLVVMAAGAGDGHRQEPTGDGVDALVPVVGHEASDNVGGEALVLVVNRGGAEVAEGATVFAGRLGHLVGGELHLHEPVVGQVAIDGFDDPVAVAPGVRIGLVGGFRSRVVFAETGDVHPVAAPAFAVLRHGLELVDELRPGVGRGFGGEGFHLFIGRLEAQEIDVGSAHEGPLVGDGCGAEALGFERGQDERINFVAGPAFVLDRGGGQLADGLEGPPFFARVDRHAFKRSGGFAGGGGGAWVRSAGGDPGFKIGDDGFGQFAGGRHLQMRIGEAERGQQAAGAGFACGDHRAAAAARRHSRFGIEHQAAHRGLQFRRVAGVAFGGHDGPNFRFEKSCIGRLCQAAGAEGGREHPRVTQH